MKLTIAVMGLLIGATPVFAQDWMPDRLYLPLASYHVNIDPAGVGLTDWNEVNPGVVLSWEERAIGLDYNFGFFKNSFAEVSTYLAVGKHFDLSDDLSLGGFLALADYHNNSQYFPVALGDWAVIPGLNVNYKNVFVQVQPAPQSGNLLRAVIAGGVTFALK